MKFLKTFLFTISFSFISFGFINLSGYCASIALEGIDSTSLPTVNNNFDVMSQFMANPDMMAFMIDDAYNSLDTYLYNTTGMDVEDHYYNGIGLRQDYTAMCDSTPLIADYIATKMYGATITGTQLLANGWQFISKSAQSMGQNAKTWFLGKVDSATNTVYDACSNMVVKMTAEGLETYSDAYSHLIDDNVIHNVSSSHPYYSQTCGISTSNATMHLHCDYPFIVFCDNAGSSSGNMCLCVPTSKVGYGSIVENLFCDFFMQNGNVVVPSDTYCWFYNKNTFTYNGVEYTYGHFRIGSLDYRLSPDISYYVSAPNGLIDILSGGASVTTSYEYSTSTLNTIRDLLSELVGKYVDSNTMDSINSVIREIPIQTYVDNEGVATPEAVITPEQVAELEAIIEQAIEISQDYAILLDNDVTADPEPEPEPTPSGDYGLVIPEDFPIDTVSPILDSVYLPSHFFSIFEPLFSVFGQHQTLLLNSWYVIPSFLIVLALFGLVL